MKWGFDVCPFTPMHVMRWTDDLTWMDSMDYLNRIHDGEWKNITVHDPYYPGLSMRDILSIDSSIIHIDSLSNVGSWRL